MSIVIQIVPLRAVEPEGVGDYARLIAERLLQDHGLRTVFIACSPLPPEQQLRDVWETHQLAKRSAKALTAALAEIDGGRPVPIILHVSGYGYQRKGTPFWLAKAIRRWRKLHPEAPLMSIFHEIHATGPITGSAFWLAPFQREVARRILHASTAAITTVGRYAALLDHWVRNGQPHISHLPVFSTIGESDDSAAPTRRSPVLAVFGRGNMNDTLYGRYRAPVEAFIAREGVRSIIDIGKRPADVPASLGGATIEALGEAPASVVRERLHTARFGLMAYDADFLAKSSIFAAYCALGTIPVCVSESEGRADGAKPGENYIKLGSASTPPPFELSQLDALQSAAHGWYTQHSLDPTIRVIYDALCGRSAAKGS